MRFLEAFVRVKIWTGCSERSWWVVAGATCGWSTMHTPPQRKVCSDWWRYGCKCVQEPAFLAWRCGNVKFLLMFVDKCQW